MGTPLAHVAWEQAVVEPAPDRELEAYAWRKLGVHTGAVPYFSRVPWLARAWVDWRPELGLLRHIDGELADILCLVISQENSCRFCHAGMRLMFWLRGFSRERIERIEQQLASRDLSARALSAVAFGRAQSRVGPSAAQTGRAALLAQGFTLDEVKEIAYAAAETDFSNRAHSLLAIPAHKLESAPDQVLPNLLRPILWRIAASRRRPAAGSPAAPAANGPFACVVEAYAGSPIAPTIERTLREMWESPCLPLRCKLLIAAVVAHGLGTDPQHLGIAQALERQGLEGAALSELLAHLRTPAIDEVEGSLLAFARQTIWYQPAQVQRSARALRQRLEPAQVVEAVGVAAVSNALCRLAPVVSDPVGA